MVSNVHFDLITLKHFMTSIYNWYYQNARASVDGIYQILDVCFDVFFCQFHKNGYNSNEFYDPTESFGELMDTNTRLLPLQTRRQ